MNCPHCHNGKVIKLHGDRPCEKCEGTGKVIDKPALLKSIFDDQHKTYLAWKGSQYFKRLAAIGGYDVGKQDWLVQSTWTVDNGVAVRCESIEPKPDLKGCKIVGEYNACVAGGWIHGPMIPDAICAGTAAVEPQGQPVGVGTTGKVSATQRQQWRELFDELYDATIAALESDKYVCLNRTRDIENTLDFSYGACSRSGLPSGEVSIRLPDVVNLKRFKFPGDDPSLTRAL